MLSSVILKTTNAANNSGIDIELVLLLLIAVAIVAVLNKFIRLPYTVLLVIAGAAIALIPTLPQVELTPDLIVQVFLPVLLFESAYNLSYKGLKQVFRLISALALLGVLATAGLVACLLVLFGVLPWQTALIFGAIIAATDPISVVATFRRLGTPYRLTILIEGESLFNDGSALVLFNLLIGIIASGSFNIYNSLAEFVKVAAGGLILGAAVGYLALAVLAPLKDYLTETLVTIIVAYGSFLLAEKLGLSPALAVVAAGLLVGNFGQERALSSTSQIAVGLSWELFGYLANSLIFLLVGLEVRAISFGNYWGVTLLAIVVTLISRVVIVTFFSWLNRLVDRKAVVPFSWQLMLIWGGLRGALALALALSLPVFLANGQAFPDRDQLLVMTFGVILFTLLVQGLTIEPLMKFLKVNRNPTAQVYEHEMLHARALVLSSVRQELQNMTKQSAISPENAQQLKAEYEAKEKNVRAKLQGLHLSNELLEQEQLRSTRRHLLIFEKSITNNLFREGVISQGVLREFWAEIDAQAALLDQDVGNDSGTPELPALIERLQAPETENATEAEKI